MRRWHILFVLLLVVSGIASAEERALKFVKKIGPGWQTDKWAWMSFVSFNSDGTMIASDAASEVGDTSGNLTLWSFPEGRLIKRLPFQGGEVSSNWKYVASSQGIVELETGKPVVALHRDVFALYAFSRDSHFVAESVFRPKINGPQIRIVDLSNGKQVSSFGQHNPSAIAISPDGTTLATGHWGIVTLWNMHTGEHLAVLRGFDRYVDSLSFSRDGKLLAAGTDGGALQIWDVAEHKRIQSVQFEWGNFMSAPAFSPDNRLIALGIYGSGTVWLVDVGSGKILDHQKVSDLGCGSVAFSPDGRFLITPSTGGLIKWPYDWGGSIRVFEVNNR